MFWQSLVFAPVATRNRQTGKISIKTGVITFVFVMSSFSILTQMLTAQFPLSDIFWWFWFSKSTISNLLVVIDWCFSPNPGCSQICCWCIPASDRRWYRSSLFQRIGLVNSYPVLSNFVIYSQNVNIFVKISTFLALICASCGETYKYCYIRSLGALRPQIVSCREKFCHRGDVRWEYREPPQGFPYRPKSLFR